MKSNSIFFITPLLRYMYTKLTMTFRLIQVSKYLIEVKIDNLQLTPYWKHKHISSCAWSKAAAAAERCPYMFQAEVWHIGEDQRKTRATELGEQGGLGKVSLTRVEINKGRTVKERPGQSIIFCEICVWHTPISVQFLDKVWTKQRPKL